MPLLPITQKKHFCRNFFQKRFCRSSEVVPAPSLHAAYFTDMRSCHGGTPCVSPSDGYSVAKVQEAKSPSDPIPHVFIAKNDNIFCVHKKCRKSGTASNNKNQDTAIQKQIMESICQLKMPYPDLFNGCCFPALSDKNILRYGGFIGDFRVLRPNHSTST